MTVQQRMQILQILNRERAKGSQNLDRDILIQQMNTTWDYIRLEITYLEEEGYVEVKRHQLGSRIFEALRITAKGINLVEREVPDLDRYQKKELNIDCMQQYPYGAALSFAGEDRFYAEALADALHRHGIKVFYDEYEKSNLWGKNLYTYLSDVYQNKARYCVMFLSQHYATKLWTNHEREAAQARAFSENVEYILPVRLDDTNIPGILPTTAYVSWPPETAETIADMIMTKLDKPSQKRS
jgi:hypothetical protein